MPANPEFADRVRAALPPDLPVQEKKMFGGIAFMVRGKMCVTVGRERMMFRIDPALHETEVERDGCRTVVMKGREYKGYIHVETQVLTAKREFNHWLRLALDYNRKLVNP